MMILRYSIILLLLVCSVCSFAQTEKLKESKDLVPESIKKLNKIEYLSDKSKFADIEYTHQFCEPRKLVEENGLKVYKQIEGSKQNIKFVFTMSNGEAELKVNGVHIIVSSGQPVQFVLAENCTKLIPVKFVSGADQEYLGIPLKKGNVFGYFVNNMGHLTWGKIDEDGYLKPSNTAGLNFFKTIQQNTFENDFYKNLLQCAMVKASISSEKGFYFLNGEKYNFSESRPNFWKAHSKYLGHRICSDQPQAKIDCEGTPSWSSFADDSIFGITEGYLNYATSKEEEVSMRQEAAEEVKQAKIIGKKCDEAVAKYEAQTGKKVKVSPFYPKSLLAK